MVVLTENEKLAAVDNAVPTTLPLSLIPSTNRYIMDAFTPIIHVKHTPRARSAIKVHNFISMLAAFILAMHMACTVDGTGESGASASLAMHDAVAPSAPLTIACLLNVMLERYLVLRVMWLRHLFTTLFRNLSRTMSKTTAGDVLVYIPNLIGYMRVLLTLTSIVLMICFPSAWVVAIICYVASFVGDLFDGMAARKFDQCSSFGGLIDMVTDRCSTTGLLCVLSREYSNQPSLVLVRRRRSCYLLL